MSDPPRTLKVAIPKGSLQEPTIELLAKAGYEIYVSSRGLRPTSNDPELDLYLIRAQEIGRYLGQGFIDCGITGYDWAYENGVDLIDLAELPYSRATTRPTKWVLVVPEDSPIRKAGGSRRQTHRHRRRWNHRALPRRTRNQGGSRIFLGCHRSQSAGFGRCDRRCHRDGFLDQGEPSPHRGHAFDVVSSFLRQPARSGGSLENGENGAHRPVAQGRPLRPRQSGSQNEFPDRTACPSFSKNFPRSAVRRFPNFLKKVGSLLRQ